jgi:putative glutamine amidotransferase
MQSRKLYFFCAATLVLLQFSSCNKETPVMKNEAPLRIAFSRCSGTAKYESYTDWIHHLDPTAVCIDLYAIPRDTALTLLQSCDALILTGGPDVHPNYYGRPEDTSRCVIDEERDTLEFELIKIARSLKMPMLGICRGMQVLNVAFGGSLIVDIPEDVGTSVIHRCPDAPCLHEITLNTASALYHYLGLRSGLVNSFHHQAIDRTASDFRISARSNDGIAEALEWKDPRGKPFLLAVQWHPERLDFEDPFAGKLALAFLHAARCFHK